MKTETKKSIIFTIMVLSTASLFCASPELPPQAQQAQAQKEFWQGIAEGNLQIIEAAVQQGANPKAENPDTGSALITPVKNKNVTMVQYLLEQKVDPNIPDEQGKVPLQYAVEENDLEMIQLLLQHKANPDLVIVAGD